MSKKKKKTKRKKIVKVEPRPAILERTIPILRGWGISETGRELDKRVAREVLGWEVREEQPAFACHTENGCQVLPPPFVMCKTPDGETVLPLFSKANHAAFDLFEKMRGMGIFCCLGICSDYHYVYDIKLTVCRFGLSHREWQGNYHPDVVITCEDFPRAMCVAALEGIRLYRRLEKETDELRNRLKNPGRPVNCS